MVLFNYSTRELTAKIVYYGPGLCGKTTNLQYIHANLPDNIRGKMLSLATKTDRTLFFDFLPVDLGEIRGMRTRVQLYTVPGQVFYNETRKLVLKGADGIVFVADSQEQMLGANVESFRNLEENLKAHGLKLAELPHILQFNKRDLPRLTSIEDLNGALNRYNAPFYESVATSGIGVQDTLKAIFKLVLLQLTRKYDPKAAPAQADRPTRATAPAAVSPAIPPSRPEADAPRPAQSARSIPVAPLEPPASRPASIPLSAMDGAGAVARAVPDPPDFGRNAMSEESEPEDMPAFASEEIEDLVHEVEESYPVAARAENVAWSQGHAASAAPAPVSPSMEAKESLQSPRTGGKTHERISPKPAAPIPGPGSHRSKPPALATPPAGRVPSFAGEAQFEVDRGFDPEWQPDSSVRPEELLGDMEAEEQGSSLDRPSVMDLPPVEHGIPPSRIAPTPEEEPVPVPVHHASRGEQAPSPAEVPPVLLTEVAEDRHLFEDPSLDVARLAAGDRREIVVPVEFAEGGTVRRFKLSIHLRFDPLD